MVYNFAISFTRSYVPQNVIIDVKSLIEIYFRLHDLDVITESCFASELRNVYLPTSTDRFRRFTIVTHGGTIADNIVFIIAAGNPTGKL